MIPGLKWIRVREIAMLIPTLKSLYCANSMYRFSSVNVKSYVSLKLQEEEIPTFWGNCAPPELELAQAWS